MSEIFNDHNYQEQEQKLEAQQSNPETQEVKSEAEQLEEKKKNEILQLLQTFPDVEKIVSILEKKLSLDEMRDFAEQLKLLKDSPAQQEKLWKQARELKTDMTNMKEEEKSDLWNKERKQSKSDFSYIGKLQAEDLQKIGQLADQWKSVQIENERGKFDEERVLPKRKALEKLGFDAESLQEKQNNVGRLTFEVFLDDFLNKKFPLPENKTDIDKVYSAWIQSSIQEISKIDHNTFGKALESTQNNNFQKKQKAEAEILRIEQDSSLSEEEKISRKQAVHLAWQQEAIAENKMLNRQEVVFSALVGHKGFFWNNGSELIYKLQIIGKTYYNTKAISIDGKWGPQTSTIAQQLLADFEDKKDFPEEAKTTLEKLLKQRKHYENQELKKQLEENQRSNIFDLSPVVEQKNSNKEKKEKADFIEGEGEKLTKKEQTKLQEQEFLTNESKKEDLFNDFSLEEIENTVPQDEYLNAIKTFLQGIQKRNPNKTELQSLDLNQLSQLIFEGNVSDNLGKKLAQAWEKSLQRKELLDQQQNWIKKHLNDTSGQVALHAAEQFFGKFGIQKNQEKSQASLAQGYFTFSDENGKEFYYRPSSGNFSTQVFHTHDKARKEIDMSGYNYRILLSIPRYSDFINKAAQDNYLLSGERPKSRHQLEQRLHEKLSGEITHTAGTIEQAGIDQIVKEEQAKTKIIEKMGKILNLTNEEKLLKEEQSPALYQLFKPFVNSCEKDNLTQLQRLEKFVEKMEDMKERSQKINREVTPETNLKEYTDQLQPKTPDELLALVLQHKDLDALKLNGKGANGNQKNGLEQLIGWLTSSQDGKDQNYDKIDDQKLNFLLNPEERNKGTNQEYRNSFMQMRSEIVGKYITQAGDQESLITGGEANKQLSEQIS